MIVCCRVEPEAGRRAVNSVFYIPLIEWLCAAGLNQKQVDVLWIQYFIFH